MPMKQFLFITFIIFTSIIFAETHWYEVESKQKQKIGYAVLKIIKEGNGYKYTENLYMFTPSAPVLVESSQAKLNANYSLISMKQKTNGKTYQYNVNRNKKIVRAKLQNGNISLPFSQNVYSSVNGPQLKKLGLLKKGAKVRIQVPSQGKLDSYQLKTVANGSLAYKNKKVRVYVIHANTLQTKGKMYVSSSGIIYKMKIANVVFRKVSKKEATGVSALVEEKSENSLSSFEVNSGQEVSNWNEIGQGNQELWTIGKNIEKTVVQQNGSYLDSLVNIKKLFGKIVKNLSLSPFEKTNLKRGFSSSFSMRKQIRAGMGRKGSYTFLHTSDNPPSLLFRLMTENGGINYHQYEFSKEKGKWSCNDVYIYSSGENISMTMSRASAILMKKSSFFDKILGKKSDGQKLIAMQNSIQKKQFSQVLNIYETLSPKAKKSKVVCLTRLQASSNVNEQEYQKATSDYFKYFGDSSSSLMGIDYYVLRKEYNNALECIDRLDKQVKDPHLEIFRANIYFAMGDSQKAKEHLNNLIKRQPYNIEPYFSLADIALQEKNFPELTKLLISLERLGMEFSDLSTVPAYAEYVASDEYTNFLNRNK